MNRQDIIDQLVTELKTISNVGHNVFSEFMSWENVAPNQMPTLIVVGGTETPATPVGSDLVTHFTVMIYGYVESMNHREKKLNDLIESVRAKVWADPHTNTLTMDRRVGPIFTDEGLFKPKGVFIMEVHCDVYDVISGR